MIYSEVLAATSGHIAIRDSRAGYEPGAGTVAENLRRYWARP